MTLYLDQIFTVTRAVTDRATGTLHTPADYSQLGDLFIAATVLGVALPWRRSC